MKRFLLPLLFLAPVLSWAQQDSLQAPLTPLPAADTLSTVSPDSTSVVAVDSIADDVADSAGLASDIGANAAATSDSFASTSSGRKIDSVAFATQRINWNSVKSYSLSSPDSLAASYQLITENGNEIKLIGPKREWTFKIESRNGSFKKIKDNGIVKFTVTLDGTPGTIEMKRHKETISFIIDFREASETGMYREFIINQTEIF